MNDTTPTFLAVAFEDVAAAEDALTTVGEPAAEKGVSIRDAAVVVRTEAGRIELEQTHEVSAGDGVIAGGAVGLVAGLLLGVPVGGALAGLLGGAGFGLRDTGIPDRRLRQLGQDLQPGHAVLCVLVDADGVGRTREVLSRYGVVVDAELSPAADP
jgi:uncharacterized membrane protein